MQKMQVIGVECSAPGAVSKAGVPYDIGQIHTIVPLAPPLGAGVAKGSMGSTYRCESALIRSVSHLPVPFVADVDVRDVMRFGKREQQVFGIVPEKLVK